MPKLISEPRDKNINFGRIAVGRSLIKQFTIRNLGTIDEIGQFEPLLHTSPFQILTALRPLTSGSSQTILVEFKPDKQRSFKEELFLKTPTTQLTILLQGDGVSPIVAIEPSQSSFDMGEVLAGDFSTTSFVV